MKVFVLLVAMFAIVNCVNAIEEEDSSPEGEMNETFELEEPEVVEELGEGTPRCANGPRCGRK